MRNHVPYKDACILDHPGSIITGQVIADWCSKISGFKMYRLEFKLRRLVFKAAAAASGK